MLLYCEYVYIYIYLLFSTAPRGNSSLFHIKQGGNWNLSQNSTGVIFILFLKPPMIFYILNWGQIKRFVIFPYWQFLDTKTLSPLRSGHLSSIKIFSLGTTIQYEFRVGHSTGNDQAKYSKLVEMQFLFLMDSCSVLLTTQ